MINSMTGFASGELTTSAGELQWELRTVNHRYLEAQFKLPEGFRKQEPVLKELISSKLQRGKLDANLQFRPSAETTTHLEINSALAKEVIARAHDIENLLHIPEPLAAMDVLRWPGVIAENKLDTSTLYNPAAQLLTETLGSLTAARGREGARIQKLLEERLTQVSLLVANVREHMPVVLNNIRNKILERAEKLSAKLDNDRLEQELVMLAQKMDVAEELDRLDAHVEETRAAFNMEGAVGRRLDFLMQEFNREANTLGSKSADPETTKAAVDLKVLIEQMREQVQNVE
ncbi:MAG: YicC family protein [Gammaproteobacteria bacterium]|nr:YicC family protein [Gammaproteobacteria bacterium]MCP4089936.1 YicC family protein [Gammaproteobacteria bacterium]MCP4276267.1 YicC family protein [Gammaproteobacteria bacterium]MCP4831262.1 YicC family protein [Gammaproteobacteria bacterium]MCP4928745.1 YicC family protein [Gammaproteobacteria bacterium]